MHGRSDASVPRFDTLAGGGAMGALMRAYDWSTSPLGGPAGWPQPLKTLVGLMLGSNQPMFLAWGPERTLLYNDAYAEILASKHPAALGGDFLDVWFEIRADLAPIVDQAYSGEPVHMDDIALVMNRKGYLEETHFAFSYTPVRDETGAVAGFFCPCVEITEQVLAGRRRDALLRLDDRLRDIADTADLSFAASELLGEALAACRVGYGVVDHDAGTITVARNWFALGFSNVAGVHRFADYGSYLDDLRQGHAVVNPDVEIDPRTASKAHAFRALGIRAHLDVPVVENGRTVAQLFVHSPVPRAWTAEEVAFAHDFAERTHAAIARRVAENALRESDDRQAFLLDISDALRPLALPADIAETAAGRLGERLRASRVFYAEIANSQLRVERDYACGVGSIVGEHSLAAFGPDLLAAYHAGAIVSVADVERDERLSAEARDGLRQRQVAAFTDVVLFEEDQWVGLLAVQSATPRAWAPAEKNLIREVAERVQTAIERARVEKALRASEARLSFLDRLGAETAALADADAVLATTTRLLAEHLNLSVCAYADMDEDEDGFTIRGDWAATGSRSIVGHYSLAAFGSLAVKNLSAGLPLVINDNLRELAPEEAATFQNIGIAATICMPLVKEGRLTALMAIHDRVPRQWAEAELSLVREVTERSWAHVERVAATADLRASEARFRLVADAVPQIVWITDAEGRVEFFNKQWTDYTGARYEPTTAAELAANHVHPDDTAATIVAFDEARRTGTTFLVEHRIRSKVGDYRWFLVRGEPYRDPQTGAVVRWFGASVDIHDRKLSDEALRESEERLRLATEAAEVGFWDVDLVSDVLVWPPRVKAMFGISPDVPVSMADFYSGLHPGDREATGAAFAAACDPVKRALYDVEYRTVGKEDGVVRWVAAKGRGVFDGRGRCVRVIGTAINITGRKQTEEALRDLNQTLEKRVAERTSELTESQRRFQGIFDSALQFMALLTPAGTVVEVNRTALSWSQIQATDIVGRPFWMAAPMRGNPELQAAVKAGIERAAAGQTVREEHEMRGAGEVRATVDFSLKPVPGERGKAVWLVAEGRDITELKRAQEALRQAQKLEAVGQLTGGVAHDFNNLLTIIKSSTDLLRRPGLAEDRRRRYVDAISDTVDRASKLTGQLLAFARRQALKPEVFDPAQRIRSITEMLRTIVGSRIEIAIEATCEPCYVEADASQFETALVNMAVNARDAMNGEGRLTIRLGEISDVPAIRGHAGGEGRFVAVSIADTGCGIPADRLTQIFEPFFTTKEVGKGTGLGLSQVFGFAKQSGGDVAVESAVGRGTTFTLYLPHFEGDRAQVADADEQRVGGVGEDGRGRRVLVVEDNVEVGQFSTQILQDLGYATTWAVNAAEALRLLAEVDVFDAVFSDVVMPGMSGVELGQEIRRRHPGLPVVLTSGYSHVLAEEGRHGFELIKKPYAAEELSRVLQRVTQASRSRA